VQHGRRVPVHPKARTLKSQHADDLDGRSRGHVYLAEVTHA
jgi:hypothetical protein